MGRSGAIAVNLHARVFALNAPFRYITLGIGARAPLYGLILFTRTLAPARDARRTAARR